MCYLFHFLFLWGWGYAKWFSIYLTIYILLLEKINMFVCACLINNILLARIEEKRMIYFFLILEFCKDNSLYPHWHTQTKQHMKLNIEILLWFSYCFLKEILFFKWKNSMFLSALKTLLNFLNPPMNIIKFILQQPT